MLLHSILNIILINIYNQDIIQSGILNIVNKLYNKINICVESDMNDMQLLLHFDKYKNNLNLNNNIKINNNNNNNNNNSVSVNSYNIINDDVMSPLSLESLDLDKNNEDLEVEVEVEVEVAVEDRGDYDGNYKRYNRKFIDIKDNDNNNKIVDSNSQDDFNNINIDINKYKNEFITIINVYNNIMYKLEL